MSSRRCQISTAFVGKQRFQCFSNDEHPDGLLCHASTAGGHGVRPGVRCGEEVGMERGRYREIGLTATVDGTGTVQTELGLRDDVC